MRYRTNRKTGDLISEIGIGSSSIHEAEKDEAVKALRRAVEGGINYFDMAAGHGDAFPVYGEALEEYRNRIFYQIHFGAD
ncbi:MAG: aldo/keto reductase, partial [Erysipelotrichaceae bacterium]|nr:aldo/keto reductase [Erysipelotrichaceae bacterium]